MFVICTTITLSAFANEYIGTCVAVDNTHVLLTQDAGVVDAQISDGVLPSTDAWEGKEIKLSSKVKLSNATASLKKCVELSATKKDPSKKEKRSAIWTPLLAKPWFPPNIVS